MAETITRDFQIEKRNHKNNLSIRYLISVELLLKRYEEIGDRVDNFFKIPFVATAAAAFETMLNELIIIECDRRFPKKQRRRLTEAHLTMNLIPKLDNLGWLLTDNEWIVDNESGMYQTLKKLNKYRHETMHGKSFYRDVEIHKWIEEKPEGESMMISFDPMELKTDGLSIELAGMREFEDIYKALKGLYSLISTKNIRETVDELALFQKVDDSENK